MIKNKMHGIEDDTKIKLVNGIIKRELAVQTEFLFHSFLVEIERKIHEPFLKDKINANMARLYITVNGICSRLEQEIGFDSNMFGGLMKSASLMLDDGVNSNGDIADPQEYILNLLIDNLFCRLDKSIKMLVR
jgi:hypothetical protein